MIGVKQTVYCSSISTVTKESYPFKVTFVLNLSEVPGNKIETKRAWNNILFLHVWNISKFILNSYIIRLGPVFCIIQFLGVYVALLLVFFIIYCRLLSIFWSFLVFMLWHWQFLDTYDSSYSFGIFQISFGKHFVWHRIKQ